MGQKTHKDGSILLINISDNMIVFMVEHIESRVNAMQNILANLEAQWKQEAEYQQYLDDCTFFKEATDLGVNSGDVWN